MQRSNSIMHKEAETTCRRTACTAALTWRHAEFMCSLPLGMWWMLLSWAPRGAMHVFLVHKASAGIKHKAGKKKKKKKDPRALATLWNADEYHPPVCMESLAVTLRDRALDCHVWIQAEIANNSSKYLKRRDRSQESFVICDHVNGIK